MKGALIAFGAALLAIAGLFAVLQAGYAWKNPCSRYGPVPAEARPTDAGGSVHETRTWWPIGSVCEWMRADGTGTVRSQVGDDALTLTTYGLAVAGVVSIAVSGTAARRREQRASRG
ncbi:hypothetical protein [Leifsonia sp. NPDC080035]|uniref:Integral membrane protein n=1 Tax=Leifsonia sp. NPDC080035 TaxID=3143936 RepID=A0AAU7G4Z9_9MICO